MNCAIFFQQQPKTLSFNNMNKVSQLKKDGIMQLRNSGVDAVAKLKIVHERKIKIMKIENEKLFRDEKVYAKVQFY